MAPSYSDPPSAPSVSPSVAGSAPPDRRRPIVTSLNGDNSWLLSFPYPTTSTPKPGQKAYYHIVYDPWLNGPAKVFNALWATFNQPHPVTVTSGAAVEDIARQIEAGAADAPSSSGEPETKSPIDAILLTFDAPDHVHEPTLRTFSPSIPVFGPEGAAAIVRKWGHFDTVIVTKDYVDGSREGEGRDEDAWRRLRPDEDGGLPPWLSFFRVQGSFFLNLAFAVIYSSPSPSGETNEALLFVPHGINTKAPAIRGFLDEWGEDRQDTSKSVLGLFHALHVSYTFGIAATTGVVGGLAVERRAKPRYWVKCHHALLVATGVFPWLSWLTDVEGTVTWALEQEKKTNKGAERTWKPNVVEVEHAACFVLE